jgi:hypothetical protein
MRSGLCGLRSCERGSLRCLPNLQLLQLILDLAHAISGR